MDFYVAIRDLRNELKRLDRLIAALEAMQNGEHQGDAVILPRRGRKNMSAEERQEVSARMKRYWASRRNGSGAASGPDSGINS